MIDTLLAPAAVQLVGAAALPVIEALDTPLPPRIVAARVRPALERLANLPLAAAPEIPWETRVAARAAIGACAAVLREEPDSYAKLLRAVRRLLRLAHLPVPKELAEEAPSNDGETAVDID